VAGGLRVEVCQDRNRASSCFCRETQNSPALNLSLTITSYASFHKSSKVLIRSERTGDHELTETCRTTFSMRCP
jgi:hypothetical protein